MSVWVVVGGQFGSEGKGKISAFITLQEEIAVCVRCGGPNSGHSVMTADGNVSIVRQLPTGFIRENTRLLLPAGALIDLQVLHDEITRLRIDPARVGVDRNAIVIEESDKKTEKNSSLDMRLSSTLCGVGAAASRRTLRAADVRLAKDAVVVAPWLRSLICDASLETNRAVDRNEGVLIEGTQGFGLSVYHSEHYPKATSRDTTAAGFISEVGLSPRVVAEVVLVLRTFPIRVAGQQAGPLEDEVSWEEIRRESGCPYPLEEKTTVTGKTRRVGRFDWGLAKKAVLVNRPTRIAINGLDYLNFEDRGKRHRYDLSERSQAFLAALNSGLNTVIGYIGTSPSIEDVIPPCDPLAKFGTDIATSTSKGFNQKQNSF